MQLAQARGDEAAAAQAQADIAVIELSQAKELAALRQQQATQAAALLGKKQQEYALTIQTNESQQQEVRLLKETVAQKQAEAREAEAGIAIKERERQQAEIMAGPIGELTRLYADQAKEHERGAAASERYQNAQTQEAENALKLAQIKGDEQEIDKAQTALNEQKIAQAQALADARAVEATDAENALSAKTLELAADGELSRADQEQLKNMAAVAEAKRSAASAAQANTEQLRNETQATRDKAEADAKAAAEMKAAAESAAQLKAAGEGVNSNWSAANKVLAETGGNMKILTAAFIANQESATRNAQGWIDWATKTAWAADTVAQSYRDQKAQLDGTVATLQRFVDEGGNVNAVQQAMIQSSGNLQNQYSLLDEQDLSNLRGALDEVNQKIREMQQETQDATTRLAELNAKIAAEKGDAATADRLKLELDQQQQLAEVEAQLAQARAQNNRELITLYEEQKQKLQELYDLKSRNLEKDIRSREEQERAAKTQTQTTTSSSGGSGSGSSGGKTYNLNLNAGGKTLNAVTNTDPGAWLDELERARRGAA